MAAPSGALGPEYDPACPANHDILGSVRLRTALVPVLVMGILAGLAVSALVLGERGSNSSGWISHATFTFGSVPAAASRGPTGTYTAADSTVPPGIPGNAEIALGMGLSGSEKDFSATIGADPGDDTNVSRFVLGFRNYHGAGSYPLTSASDADLDVTVRNWRGDTDTWGMEHSTTATCAVRIAADAAMRDPSIRRISGTFACRGIYDTNNHTSTTTLRGRFDIFTEVWCGGPGTRSCRPPPSGTIPGPPDD